MSEWNLRKLNSVFGVSKNKEEEGMVGAALADAEEHDETGNSEEDEKLLTLEGETKDPEEESEKGEGNEERVGASGGQGCAQKMDC